MQRVLIVEDDIDLRRMFRLTLALAGYEVLEAGDGLEALRWLDATDVAGIVLDLGLPLVSGQVVLQEVAAQAAMRDVPVVVVTAYPRGDLDRATCVLTKPVNPEQLVATVRRCLPAGSSANGA